MAWRSGVALVLVLLASMCPAQDFDDDPCNDTGSQVSCDACISASHRCSWCPYNPNITLASEAAQEQRCRLTMNPPSSCPGDVPEEDPVPETIIIRNVNLTTSEAQRPGQRAVQVSPQNISLSLRRDAPRSFNMTFRSLRNSPLDLYFLIDFSSSQNLVVSRIQRDLPQIGEAVRDTVSSNFQMGFGSFVDKPILPYAASDYRENSTIEGLRCRGFPQCTPTYAYRNSQPLTANIMQLSRTFNESSELSSNIDSPEGSLEALLQVAVCTNETGWRPDALHMIFLITDQGFHLAGDGKLGGILTPNDGLCHQAVGESGQLEYTHALLQDYPSLFQIINSLETNLIVPVFTLRSSIVSAARVNASLVPLYNMLANDLNATRAQAIVFEQSSSTEITRVIRQSYESTVQNIRVNIPSVPGYTFTIDPIEGCENRSEDGSCQLQFEEEVTFSVTVTLDDCEAARRSPSQVQLLGPPFSFTTIDLQPLCQCECSEDGPEINSTLCSSRGDLECGLCDCPSGIFFGLQCECDMEVRDCPSAAVGSMMTTSMCSGADRGVCSTCGTCRCFEGFFGDACQCTEGDCDDECSATGIGRCSCGAVGSIPICKCDPAPLSGFPFFSSRTGEVNCDCNPDDCFNRRFPGELCHISTDTNGSMSGNTLCGCGMCNCPAGFRATEEGNLCIPLEECTDMIETCARCRLSIDNTTSQCSACTREIPFLGDGVEPANFTRGCNYRIDGCDYIFYLDFSSGILSISFTRLGCTNQALPWIITGSLVGAIILLGLLFLIILKLLLLVWDRHEYKKFTQELKDADFAPVDNPLYLTPQQDYQNPIRRPTKRVVQPQPEQ